jgi:hypothetical protein
MTAAPGHYNPYLQELSERKRVLPCAPSERGFEGFEGVLRVRDFLVLVRSKNARRGDSTSRGSARLATALSISIRRSAGGRRDRR